MNYNHQEFLDKIYSFDKEKDEQNHHDYIFDYTEDLFQEFIVQRKNIMPVVKLMRMLDFNKISTPMVFTFISRFRTTKKDMPQWSEFMDKVEAWLIQNNLDEDKRNRLKQLLNI